MKLHIKFSITFVAFGRYWLIANHGHCFTGQQKFTVGTVITTRHCRWCSSQHTVRDAEQQRAHDAFLAGLDD